MDDAWMQLVDAAFRMYHQRVWMNMSPNANNVECNSAADRLRIYHLQFTTT